MHAAHSTHTAGENHTLHLVSQYTWCLAHGSASGHLRTRYNTAGRAGGSCAGGPGRVACLDIKRFDRLAGLPAAYSHPALLRAEGDFVCAREGRAAVQHLRLGSCNQQRPLRGGADDLTIPQVRIVAYDANLQRNGDGEGMCKLATPSLSQALMPGPRCRQNGFVGVPLCLWRTPVPPRKYHREIDSYWSQAGHS